MFSRTLPGVLAGTLEFFSRVLPGLFAGTFEYVRAHHFALYAKLTAAVGCVGRLGQLTAAVGCVALVRSDARHRQVGSPAQGVALGGGGQIYLQVSDLSDSEGSETCR